MGRKSSISSGTKKRGRPKKVYHEDPEKDYWFHQPHDTWDFTDYVVPFCALSPSQCDGVGTERYDFWTRLEVKTLEIAHEICPDTDRPHGQGRVRFPRKIRFEALKKILPPDVHFEPTKCCKDDNYLRKHGSVTLIKVDNRHQGRRNIFREQGDAIAAGATIRECRVMEGANYQSIRSAELLMKYIEPERPIEPREVILVANAAQVPMDVYRVQDRYWDGYDAHDAIYIRHGITNFSIAIMSQLTGPAPFRVCRGRQARYNKIYISGLDAGEIRQLRLG